jgi:hypothetical protein
MANPLKGEVALQVGGTTYTLRLATNAIVSAETLLDKGVGEIAAMLQDPASFRLGTARALLFAALQERHPEITLEGAGELIGDVGIPKIVSTLAASMRAAFPSVKENPQKAGPKRRTSRSS